MALFDPKYIHVYKLFIIHTMQIFFSLYVFVELKKCKKYEIPTEKKSSF